MNADCCHPVCREPATDEWKGWAWCRDHFFLVLQMLQEPVASEEPVA